MSVPAPFAWNHCPICGGALVPRHDGHSDRPYCGRCLRFYYSNPVPAACCIVARGDQVLLVQRSVEPCLGQWTLPGGFVEIGETSEDAVLRELLEETGLRGASPRLLAANTQKSRFGSVLVLGYHVERWEGTPVAATDAMDARFFAPPERPPLAFQAHREIIAIYDALRCA